MLAIKAALGALAVILIQLLAQTRYYYLAALVPLFPTFALISHAILGSSHNTVEFKTALLFSMLALLPYLAYTVSVYCSVDKLGLWGALIFGVVIWIGCAALLIIGWQRLMPSAIH